MKKNQNIIKTILIVGFAIVMITSIFSCEKNITIKPIPYESKVSIQSMITPNATPKVYFYKTVPFFDSKITLKSLFIQDAVVQLSYSGTSITLKPDSVFNNIKCEHEYFYSSKTKIEANTSYTLSIKYGIENYIAQAVTNQKKIALEAVDYTPTFKDLYGEHEGVIVKYTDVPNEENYYRYEMGRFIQDTVTSAGGIKVLCTVGKLNFVKEIGRTIYADGNVGSQSQFVFEPTYKHKKDQVAYLKLQTVDKNIQQFFDNLDRQKLAQFNPFVEPVFLKDGQFGTKAFGFFGAYAVSDSVKFVYPE